MSKMKSYFYTGLISILPIVLTLYIFNMIFQMIFSFISQGFISKKLHSVLDSLEGISESFPIFDGMAGILINLLSILIMILTVTVIGYTLNHVFFNSIINRINKFLERAPIVKYIYTTVSQIVGLVSSDKATTYQKVVVAEYPRKGVYSIGFLTASKNSIVEKALGEQEMYNIFIPTSPNPTSGMFIVIPKKDIVILDMKVDDAVKLIISGGAIVPQFEEKGE